MHSLLNEIPEIDFVQSTRRSHQKKADYTTKHGLLETDDRIREGFTWKEYGGNGTVAYRFHSGYLSRADEKHVGFHLTHKRIIMMQIYFLVNNKFRLYCAHVLKS